MLICFVHRFNDIDHLTPVVYKIAKETEEKIMMLSFNPNYNISDDFRLKFLKEECNVQVEYLFNVYAPSKFHKILAYLLCSSAPEVLKERNVKNIIKYFINTLPYRRSFFHDFIGLIPLAFQRLIGYLNVRDRIYKNYYGEKWVDGMMKLYQPSVLIFDHAATTRIYNVRALWNVSKEMGIPTISLPHGVPLFLKHSSDYDRGKRDYVNNECDFLVFQHRRWKDENVEYGVNPDKVAVMGLPRYCKEWENVLHEIVPPDMSLEEKGNGKLKVVYMDSVDRYHGLKNMAKEAIEIIGKLDFVHLIYKPHTRRNVVNLNIPSNLEISTRVNSVNLIKWADVVIGMQSSIMIEVLIQGKVYISPTYFRERKMIYEEHGACWMVNSYSELEAAFHKLREDPSFRPYSKESVESFLTEIVYDGQKGKDVLGAYKKFILDIAKGNQKCEE